MSFESQCGLTLFEQIDTGDISISLVPKWDFKDKINGWRSKLRSVRLKTILFNLGGAFAFCMLTACSHAPTAGDVEQGKRILVRP